MGNVTLAPLAASAVDPAGAAAAAQAASDPLGTAATIAGAPKGVWAAAGVNGVIPFTQNINSNTPVQTYATRDTVMQAGNGLKGLITNYFAASQGEVKTIGGNRYDATYRVGIRAHGKVYQMLWNGSIDGVVPYGTGKWSDGALLDVAATAAAGSNVVVYPSFAEGEQIEIRIRVTPNNISTATLWDHNVNTYGQPGLGEGVFLTSSTATDYTTFTAPGDIQRPTLVTRGVNAAGAVDFILGNPGVSATALTAGGVSIQVFDPQGAGSGAGATYGTVGTPSGQTYPQVTSLTGVAGGLNYSNRVKAYMYNGGIQFGQNTAIFGLSAIAVNTVADKGSIMIWGNSWDAGKGANDGVGDELRCFGETRIMARNGQHFGMLNASVTGNYCASFASTNYDYTVQLMLSGVQQPAVLVVCDPTNDIGIGSYSLANIEASWGGCATKARNTYNFKAVRTRIVAPRCTSTQGVLSATPNAGGSGYVVGDVLTAAGGTLGTGTGQNVAATLKVTSVNSGAITGLQVVTIGYYTTNPSTTANAVTGGTGSGATVNLTMAGFMDEISQTAATGFGTGGLGDSCNAWLRAGSSGYDQYDDTDGIYRSTKTGYLFAWKQPPRSTGLYNWTGDGIHKNANAIDIAGELYRPQPFSNQDNRNLAARITFGAIAAKGVGVQAGGAAVTDAGSVSFAARYVTSSITAQNNDRVILADATAGALTITLPNPADTPGMEFKVKKVDSSANAVTVVAATGVNGVLTGQIDNNNSVSLTTLAPLTLIASVNSAGAGAYWET